MVGSVNDNHADIKSRFSKCATVWVVFAKSKLSSSNKSEKPFSSFRFNKVCNRGLRKSPSINKTFRPSCERNIANDETSNDLPSEVIELVKTIDFKSLS